MTINSAGLALAIQHHQAGRLQAAEQIYRQILQVEPNHADALHLLGVIAYQVGKHEFAIEYIARAIGLKANEPVFHNNLGNALKNQGKLDEAVACYRRALDLKADFVEVYNNLGVALKDRGKLDEAVACCRRALQLKPDYAEAYNNLGVALKDQGKVDEAAACYGRALELKPDFAWAHTNLGVALKDLGKLDQAVACHRRALELKPDYAEAHSNLGNALMNQGKLDEAVVCYRRALDLKPDSAGIHNNLGNALMDQGKLDEAAACYGRALELKPDYAEAHSNLGNALMNQGKLDEAVVCYRRALDLKPNYAEAHSNLGNALMDQGKLDEAVACCRRALELKPDYAEAHGSLGNAWMVQGKLDEAAACCHRALELRPGYAEAHVMQSLLSLLSGHFERGWAEYEWRLKTKPFQQGDYLQPVWDGQPLEGRTILLRAEQGLGDTIQFVRYAPQVKQRGGTVIVECPRPLLSLLTGCAGIDRLVGRGNELPAFDVQAPLLSLPGIFHTGLRDIPAAIPYLFAVPGLVEHWRQELDGLAGFKIGIVWQGNPQHKKDRSRSFPLAQFASLARVPGVKLISLQKGTGTEQLAEAGASLDVLDLGPRLDEAAGPFMDTAALMKSLDLVISSDTAIAHLAGALGVRVWVALPFVPDWRWLLERSDSPWYPTMRLFRQGRRGDWQGVFRKIEVAVGEHLARQALPPNGES